VVRLSTADAGWLYPGRTARQVCERLHELGVALAVVTDGGLAATAMTASAGAVTVAAPAATVVDTIGAGDTFNGAMLVWLDEHEFRDAASVTELEGEVLRGLLYFANSAATLTCERPGADPPWRTELDKRGAAAVRYRAAPAPPSVTQQLE
jgi:fructokinase